MGAGQVTSWSTVRRRRDLWFAAAGVTGYVVLGGRSSDRPHGVEERLFAAVNHGDKNHPLLRVPQQLGTPWVLPGVALTALALRRFPLAVVAACALPVEKALEVGIKKVVDRDRPAQADPDAVLRDDAPADGPSYPSGHAALAAAAVVVTSPYLPAPVVAVGAATALVTAAVRVSQGAHFPVDAVGGTLLGVAVASGLTALVGRPAP